MIQPICIVAHDTQIGFRIDLDPSCVADAAIAWYLRQGLPCEPEVTQFMMRAVRLGDLVVDAGANVGFFTLVLAALVGPSGKVLAIEPGLNNIDKLKKNIAISHFQDRVEHVAFPLADRRKGIAFYEYQDSGLNACWSAETGGQPFPTTAYSFADVLGDRVPRLIKMDIEGSELNALQGLTCRPDFIICEFNPRALKHMEATPQMVQLFMLQRGYEMYALRDDGKLPARVPPAAELRIERENTNVLFALPSAFDQLWNRVEL